MTARLLNITSAVAVGLSLAALIAAALSGQDMEIAAVLRQMLGV